MTRDPAIPIPRCCRTLVSGSPALRLLPTGIRGIAAFFLLLVATPVVATEFCVTTVDELRFALQRAADDDVVIKVVQGTYDLGSAPFPLQDSGW